jgi:hypothetical protein
MKSSGNGNSASHNGIYKGSLGTLIEVHHQIKN